MTTFEELQEQLFDLYAHGRLREALEVATRAAERFPENAARTSYWRACLRSCLGEAGKAIALLEDAVREGAWWSEATLNGDPDFDSIRHTPEFQEIVRECALLHATAQEAARPELLVVMPEAREGVGSAPQPQPQPQLQPLSQPGVLPPLLILLHSRGANAQRFARFGKVAARAGILVAVPQSSQVCGKDEFCWDDEGLAEREVSSAYSKVAEAHRFDAGRVILAGASQGGRIAITMALKGEAFRSRGFIAVVPAVRDAEALVPFIEPAVARGVRGYIITGDKDQFYQDVRRMHAAMEDRALRCELDVRPGMGHRFPPDFPATLERAVDFILG